MPLLYTEMIVTKKNTLQPLYLSFTGGGISAVSSHKTSSLERTPAGDTFVKSPSALQKLRNDKISFGYEFILKKPRGIPCAYCGTETVSQDEVYYITELKGKELVGELEKFASSKRTQMNQQAREALELFEKTALDNPDKNGAELLPVAYTRARNRMLIKQTGVYSRAEKLAEQIGARNLLRYLKKVKTQDVIIKPDISIEELSAFLTNNTHIEFRKDILSTVLRMAGNNRKIDNVDTWSAIVREISTLPSSKTDPDAYLVKYISKALRKDPKMENELVLLNDSAAALFYAKLLEHFVSSAEHIKPFSDGGECSSNNYLVTHAYCNQKRGNRKWSEYMLSKPERFDSVLKNLQEISENPKIAQSVSGFDVKSYVKNVKNRMVCELVGTEDIPEVKEFEEKLSEIGCDETYFPSSDTRLQAVEIISPALQIDDPKSRNAALEKLLKSSYFEYYDDRSDIFSNLISHTGDTRDGEKLAQLLIDLMYDDPVLSLHNPDYARLSGILNKSYNLNYIIELNQKLEELGLDTSNPETDRNIILIKRKLPPLRKANAYVIKLLLDSRVARGVYDVENIKAVLESK